MADYMNIRMSAEATHNIDRMCERFRFPTQTSAIKFCIMYALKNHLEEMDFETLDKDFSSDGTNLNVGTVDDDGTIKRLIPIYYPSCETPYRYARVAAIFGSIKIASRMESNPSLSLFDLL